MPVKDVVVLFAIGQSNIAGNESNTSLPNVYKEMRSDIKIWQGAGTNFVDLQQTTNTYPSINDGLHASEFACAWLMCNALGKDIYVVKHAAGGTSMSDYWHVGGSLYTAAKATLTDALTYLTGTLGYTYRLAGLFSQGEHDANSLAYANAYQALYQAQLADLFSSFDFDAYLCTQLRLNIGGTPFDHELVVRAAQQNVIDSYSGNSFPVGIYDPSPNNEGNLHFGEPGYTTKGTGEANWLISALT
jgi:hypothetical protein